MRVSRRTDDPSLGNRLLRAVAVAVCLTALAKLSHAGSGSVFRVPSGGTPKNGLQLIVDARWVDGNGYMPVKVTLLPWPAGPATASRTIQVVLVPDFALSRSREDHQVTGTVELTQGATRGEATLAVHRRGAPQYLSIRVYEDGAPLEDLSLSYASMGGSSRKSEAVPTLLVIDADAPTRDAREQLLRRRLASSGAPAAAPAPRLPNLRQLPPFFFPESDFEVGPPDDGLTLAALDALPRVELLPPAELPQRWIEFTSFDMIFVSAADLQSLAAQQPATWQAIRQWLATGPTLCVYDMELSSDALSQLESQLELMPPANRDPSDGVRARWRAPDPSTASADDVTALRTVRYSGAVSYPPDSPADSSAAGAEPAAPTPPAEPPFLVREVALGRVVAMRAAEPLVDGRYAFAWLLNDLGSSSWMWYQRHGMSLMRANRQYWDWVVPGLGLTPVGTFLVLISLFVVGIGPVNYFVLRRRRRLHMLLVTVPVGAALVTVAMCLYALIGDGLGVRVRVRGLTEIDQRRGLTVSWSRQSYYAGLAPADGLRFPEHTAVYPIEFEPDRWDENAASRRVVWDGTQHLAAGYLGSRSTSQLLVIDAASSTSGLDFVEGGADAPSLTVTNRLPARLEQLAVWDSGGRCFWHEGLAPGQTAAMTPTPEATATAALGRTLLEHQPAFPEGYDSYNERWGGTSYYFSTLDYQLPNPDFSTGILERGLAAAVDAGGRAREPRTYVAVAHTTPGVPLGYRHAREEASIYIIQGKW